MKTRKSVAALSADEKAAYVDGVKRLKTNGHYDQYVQTHYNAMVVQNTAHRGPNFLPWHREFLLRLEREIQGFYPNFALPYWDWAADSATGAPQNAPVWGTNFMGGDGNPVTTGPFAGTANWPITINSNGQTVPAYPLARHFGSATGLPTQQMVNTTLGFSTYDTAPWNSASANSFRNSLEVNLHNPVHGWVGGEMIYATSPNDPVFFLHHCNVDRLWAQWQMKYPSSGYLPTSGGPAYSNLNDAMWPWNTASDSRSPANVVNFWDLGYEYDTVPAPPAADFSGTTIQVNHMNVTPGPNFAYNTTYGGSWRILQGGGYFDVSFNLTAVNTGATLNFLHLTSSLWPNPGYSPINITVNGQSFKNNYDVAAAHNGSKDYERDNFPAASVLKVGANSIRVTLQQSAKTHYWIRNLTVMA